MIENMTDDSIYELYRMAVNHFPSGSRFAEIGCYYGNSVLFMAKEIQKANKDIEVIAIDKWDYKEGVEGEVDIYKDFYENINGFHHIVMPIRGDSIEVSHRISGVWNFDFVYIDADHKFDAVLNDIMSYRKLMRKGGWIAGHDYGDEGVFTAVNTVYNDMQVEKICNESWLVRL